MTRSSLKDFETVSRLGSGSFGTVYKVKRLIDDKSYVIKTVRIVELSYKEQTEAINEVQILAQLKSPYVVRYYDSFIEKDSLHIVMEFCNRGDLQNLIRKAKEKNVAGLKENVIWNIALQVMLGLQYLHRKHILHRDLKSANVFLMKDESKTHYLVKIGDLGVAKLMDTSTALASTIVGTPYYLSPELCMDMPYRDKSDCWAFGVLTYECCTLEHPFEARNQCALIMKIIEAQVKPPSSSVISYELRNLILWLLQKDPELRPSIRDILCEEYVRKKMQEHKFDVPHELRDQPLRNILGLHDFENDENTKRKRSSIKMLADISSAQQSATESYENANSGSSSSNGNGGGGSGSGGNGKVGHSKIAGGIASVSLGESAGGGSDDIPSGKNPHIGEIGHRNSNIETSKWNSVNNGNSNELKADDAVDGNQRAPPRGTSSSSSSGTTGGGSDNDNIVEPPAPRLGAAGKAPSMLRGSRRNLNAASAAESGAATSATTAAAESGVAPVRGNRVRGPSFRGRVTSETAMSRHQVTRNSTDSASSSAADSKHSGDGNNARPPPGSLLREPSKKIEIDFDEEEQEAAVANHSGPSYYNSSNADETASTVRRGTWNRADSKEAADQHYEEDFEHYDADDIDAAASKSPASVDMIRNSSAKGEDYDGFNQDAPLRHYSQQQQRDNSDDDAAAAPAPMLMRGKQRQGSFKATEPDYVPPDQRSPLGNNFHDTDGSLSLQLGATGGTDSSNWDPVWTQRRGFIGAIDSNDERSSSSSPTGPVSVTKSGAPLRRFESHTAEYAMGPTKEAIYDINTTAIAADADATFSQASTPVNRQRRDTDLSATYNSSSREDIEFLLDRIDEARMKAENALGPSLFKKVYDLCSLHMSEPCRGEDLQQPSSANLDGGEDGAGGGASDIASKREQTQPFIKELDRVLLSENSSGGIEVACEAVFGVKLLLALESKYESTIKQLHE